MHHYLSKLDYLEEVQDELAERGALRRDLNFDTDFVLIEEDWANGVSPEDVARRIYEGAHRVATKSEFYAH